jgi:hypothetical protein
MDKLPGAILRILTPLAGLYVLSGCNLLVSKEPWFTEADAVDAPKFRDGLWTSTRQDDCKFDSANDPSTWPDCALAAKVRDNRWSSLERERGDDGNVKKFVWEEVDTLTVGGEPLIVQFKTDPQGLSDPSEQFVYLAARPTQIDAQGKVIAFSAWAIVCGPVDRRAKKNSEDALVTKKPFKGLSVTEYNCVADGADAIRYAARQSENLVSNGQQQQTTVHWVRD